MQIFQKIKIQKSNFFKIGNDAIDTSGSSILTRKIKIIEAGDKAFSIGEKSHLAGEELFIEKSNIGIAIKDLSQAEIKNLNIINTNVGITAFQKKSEYGPATAKIEITKIEEVRDSYMIEDKSNIFVNGNLIKGEYKNLREKFY